MKFSQFLKEKKFYFFFNNIRGLEVLNFFLKKKISNYEVILSKKFLNQNILNLLNKKKIHFQIIHSLKNKNLLKKFDDSDLGIVCGFPLIFSKKLINKFKFGLINCHAGKLPDYRGGSPLNWQLINNEKTFGISIIKINNIIDGGPIINEKNFKLLNRFTINDLHFIANKNFPKLAYDSVKKIFMRKELKKQNEIKAKTYRQRSSKDSKMNIKKMTFDEVNCYVRSLQDPYPNAFLKFIDKIIEIQKIKKSKYNLKPGIIEFKKNKVFAGCLDSTIELIKYKI